MEIYCKCGCGRLLPNQKAKRGYQFLNRNHAAAWRGQMRKGTKLGPYKVRFDSREVDYSQGKVYCKKYNDEDIKCVICYEQNLRKECLEK